MTHDQAIALSKDLAAIGVSHTIEVGYHDERNQPIQCRVDLAWPRAYGSGLAGHVRRLSDIGERHDLTLHTALMGNGLTFSTKAAVDELLGRLRG